MTPEDIAADVELMVPFLAHAGYAEPLPGQPQALEILFAEDATRVIAAVWPLSRYAEDWDLSRESYTGRSLDEELNSIADQRVLVAERVRGLLAAAARACGVRATDLRTHLEWSARLSSRELDRLLAGHDTFPLSVVADMCRALQLEYRGGWFLNDPDGLRLKVERSVLANEISHRLYDLPVEKLEWMHRRLPSRSADPDDQDARRTCAPPAQEARYWSLHAALVSDLRNSPVYSLDQIDSVLAEGGEPGLPESARRDRFWWAGSAARSKGRPQVRAWWAAGYRVGEVVVDPGSGMVGAVKFESLPGRSEWVRQPAQLRSGGYSPPEPARVPIELHKPSDAPTRAEEATETVGPSDPDIRRLREFLETAGEADRSQVEALFADRDAGHVDPQWLTNLLTRARRQGWIVRYGIKSRPRWVAAGSKGDHMLWIASFLGFECPSVADPSDVASDRFVFTVAKHLPVEVGSDDTSREVARAIIEWTGQGWDAGYVESHGAQQGLTLRGVKALRRAVSVAGRSQ